MDVSFGIHLKVSRNDLGQDFPVRLIAAQKLTETWKGNPMGHVQPEDVIDGCPHAPMKGLPEELGLCEDCIVRPRLEDGGHD